VSGLVGVYSPELTRESVWEAFQRRHVYGTSGPKIILEFSAADSVMGSDVTWSASKGPIPLDLRAIGCDEIASVEIIRNGRTIIDEKTDSVYIHFLMEDTQTKPGTSWYYARVLQKDGNIAWSSPVWVTVE
jgi:hypothetical protein